MGDFISSNVKVSVVVPVYNVEKYLRKSLDSLINQTLKDIEIICVNDGSTDNSLAILEEYALKDNRIKIITKENGGLSSARNAGMKHITGEYTSFIDSDDWVETDAFELLFRFSKLKDLDILMFPFKFYDEDTSEVYQTQYNSLEVIDSKFNEEIFTYIDVKDVLFKIAHSPVNKLYKTSYLNDINAHFEEGLNYEDIAFFFPTFLNAKKVSICRKSFYFYRIRDKSISTTGDEGSYDIFKILTIFLNVMKEKDLFKELKQDILMYLIVNIKFVYIRLNEQYRNDYFKLISEYYEKFDLNQVDKECLKKWHFDDRVFYEAISKSNNGVEFELRYKMLYYEFLSYHYENLYNDTKSENERLLNDLNQLQSKNADFPNKIKNIFKK
ncbi:glycosyltransferase [Methanobrevibacter sp. DSM 116169]|uniref:glycosyltransferase n=1 Tax=Methanobrevibacter sp. DSM 116169 TaxID=3242727 RepID=UPI0038FC42FC